MQLFHSWLQFLYIVNPVICSYFQPIRVSKINCNGQSVQLCCDTRIINASDLRLFRIINRTLLCFFLASQPTSCCAQQNHKAGRRFFGNFELILGAAVESDIVDEFCDPPARCKMIFNPCCPSHTRFYIVILCYTGFNQTSTNFVHFVQSMVAKASTGRPCDDQKYWHSCTRKSWLKANPEQSFMGFLSFPYLFFVGSNWPPRISQRKYDLQRKIVLHRSFCKHSAAARCFFKPLPKRIISKGRNKRQMKKWKPKWKHQRKVLNMHPFDICYMLLHVASLFFC